MSRVANWEAVLAREIEDARARPFRWGVHDCAIWAWRVRARLRGEDPTPPWLGRYTTARGAFRALRRDGSKTLADGVTARIGPPLDRPLFARRGDVALIDAPLAGDWPDALAVVAGRVALVPGPGGSDGLTAVPVTAIRAAWRT